ncbi:MAG: aminotransferase class V-fold PLP-dependent enzyme [Desulfobacterales bacterium]|jgi:selenocysteine lyase/cysteine desulfurase
MDILDVREEFPIKRNRVYLNNASIGPLSNPVISAVDAFMADVRDNGRNHYPQWCEQADHVIKSRIAGMIGADKSEIAYIKNTTEGILIVANGIDWQRGDNVIIADIEYPSNVYCWMNLKKRGVQIRWISSRGGRFTADDVKDLMDSHTRLVSLSAVQFLNGFRLDLEKIGELCHARNVMLNLDAIQLLGALHLDVSRYHIDFLSAGGHKWLMAPIGTGIFYCRRSSLAKLHPINIGYHSVDKSEDDINYDLTFKPHAGRFEEAIVNFPGIWGLDAAIDMITRLGTLPIEQHILKLTHLAYEGLKVRNYEVVSSTADKERSGILCFKHPSQSTQQIWQRLEDANIHLAIRGDALRMSPSFYNDEDEVNAMLAALP